MAHVTTNGYNNSYVLPGGGITTCTNSVDTGTGANRVVIVTHFRRIDRAIAIQSVTLGGQAMTVLGDDITLLSLYTGRVFALVNPSFTGLQDCVVTCSTNDSISAGNMTVSVYDDVDPNASAASLLTASQHSDVLTPWTDPFSINVPTTSGYTTLGLWQGFSNDVGFTISPSGCTERLFATGGGPTQGAYDTVAGSSSASMSWTPTGLTQDMGLAVWGFSLPPPSSLSMVRQCSNGEFQSQSFQEIASLYPAMRIGANVGVQVREMIEDTGRTTHQINSSGIYRCGLFREI